MTPQQLIDMPGYGKAPKWCRENGYWLSEPTAEDIYDWMDYKRVMVISNGDLIMDWDGTSVPQFNTVQGVLSDAMEAHE